MAADSGKRGRPPGKSRPLPASPIRSARRAPPRRRNRRLQARGHARQVLDSPRNRTPNGAVAERGLVVVTVLPIDNVPWLVAVLQTESDATILWATPLDGCVLGQPPRSLSVCLRLWLFWWRDRGEGQIGRRRSVPVRFILLEKAPDLHHESFHEGRGRAFVLQIARNARPN